MELRVLGPVELRLADAAPVRLSLLERGLLSLAAFGGSLTTSSLSEWLWDDSPPVSARNRVQALVSGIRRKAGADGAILVTDGSGYRLDARLPVDLTVWEQLVCRARSLRATSPEEALDLYGQALDVFGETPLQGAPETSAVQLERERLSHARLTALEERIDTAVSVGRLDGLVAELATLTSRHPYNETFLAQFVLVLAALGQQARALEVYRDAYQRLDDELGVEPSPRLREAQQRVLTGDLPRPAHTSTVATTIASSVAAADEPPATPTTPAAADERGPAGAPAETEPVPVDSDTDATASADPEPQRRSAPHPSVPHPSAPHLSALPTPRTLPRRPVRLPRPAGRPRRRRVGPGHQHGQRGDGARHRPGGRGQERPRRRGGRPAARPLPGRDALRRRRERAEHRRDRRDRLGVPPPPRCDARVRAGDARRRGPGSTARSSTAVGCSSCSTTSTTGPTTSTRPCSTCSRPRWGRWPSSPPAPPSPGCSPPTTCAWRPCRPTTPSGSSPPPRVTSASRPTRPPRRTSPGTPAACRWRCASSVGGSRSAPTSASGAWPDACRTSRGGSTTSRPVAPRTPR